MKIHSGWLAAALLLSVLLACNFSTNRNSNNTGGSGSNTSSASTSGPGEFVNEIRMAKDNGSGDPEEAAVEVFGPTDRTIHCVIKLKESDSGTKIKFSWIIVDAEGAKNEKIKEIEYTTKALENVVHAHLTLPRDWPKGKYKVDVYVNDKLDKTINYSVE
jgi:hypothetical protein